MTRLKRKATGKAHGDTKKARILQAAANTSRVGGGESSISDFEEVARLYAGTSTFACTDTKDDEVSDPMTRFEL